MITRTKHLFCLGSFILATWMVLQRFANRSGSATDATDFVLGAVYGIGIGLLLLAAWRSRRACRI